MKSSICCIFFFFFWSPKYGDEGNFLLFSFYSSSAFSLSIPSFRHVASSWLINGDCSLYKSLPTGWAKELWFFYLRLGRPPVDWEGFRCFWFQRHTILWLHRFKISSILQKVYGSEKSFRTQKVLIAAKLANADITLITDTPPADKFPLGVVSVHLFILTFQYKGPIKRKRFISTDSRNEFIGSLHVAYLFDDSFVSDEVAFLPYFQ